MDRGSKNTMVDTTHIPYNNRFRSSSSGGGSYPQTAPVTSAVGDPQLQSVSQGIPHMFGHSSSPFSPCGSPNQNDHQQQADRFHRILSSGSGTFEYTVIPHRMTSFEHPVPVSTEVVLADSDSRPRMFSGHGEVVLPPVFPGKPRRLSRQTSHNAADVKRQLFAAAAASRNYSEEGGMGAAAGQIVTSVDSSVGCDDVFVETAPGEAATGPSPSPVHHHHHHPRALILPDTSLFRSRSTLEVNLSTSSSASMLPQSNPYNRINHMIHSAIWCCSCFYLLFFCCLPAIHHMEQGDVEYSRNNHKRARSLGRTASFLFFTGTLIALSIFALIFFLAIFFAVY